MIEKVLEPQEALRVEMEKIAAGGDATLDDFKGKKIKYAIIEGPLGQELETLGFQGRAGDYDPYVNFTFQTKNDISFDDAKNLAQRAEAIIHKHGRQTKTGDENPTDRANPLVDQEYYGTHSITTRIYIRVYVPETDWRKELKRKVTEASAILSIGTELEKITPREHRDNVSRIFRRHYRFAIEGLKAFGINTDGAPDLEEIATKLTPET